MAAVQIRKSVFLEISRQQFMLATEFVRTELHSQHAQCRQLLLFKLICRFTNFVMVCANAYSIFVTVHYASYKQRWQVNVWKVDNYLSSLSTMDLSESKRKCHLVYTQHCEYCDTSMYTILCWLACQSLPLVSPESRQWAGTVWQQHCTRETGLDICNGAI